MGKLHCLHNWEDDALQASTGLNILNRAGQAGIGTRDKNIGGWREEPELLHPEIRDHYHNKHVLDELRKINKKNEHSYQWFDFAIKYYKNDVKL